MLLLTACSSGSSSSSRSPTATGQPVPTATAAPVPGGVVRIGIVQEPPTLLAAGIISSTQFAAAIDAPITEGLLWYRSSEETAAAKSLADDWQPWLATEVPTLQNGDVHISGCVNADAGMCVTWKLRSGVLWQDGAAFSSKDVCDTVRFFWLRYRDHNPSAIVSTQGWDQMIACDDSEPMVARIDYKTEYGGYLGQLTGVYGVLPSRELEAAFAHDTDLEQTAQSVDLTLGSGDPDAFRGTDTLDHILVGTGPYVLARYDLHKDIVLVPNRNYWNHQFTPQLGQVIFTFVPSVDDELAAATTGAIDVGFDYRISLLGDLGAAAAAGRLAIQTIPDAGAEKIDFNLCAAAKGLCGGDARQSAVTADPKFRRAVLEAIDRNALIASVAPGMPGITTVPHDAPGYLGDEYTLDPATDPITGFDVAKANAGLDAAGYMRSANCHAGKGRAALTGACIDLGLVTTSGDPARSGAAVTVQSELQQIGIFTTITEVSAAKMFGGFADGGVLYTHHFDLAMYSQTMTAPPDPDSWFATYHADCGGGCTAQNQIPSMANRGIGQNDTGIDDVEVDDLLSAARFTADLGQRAQDYRQAWALLAKDLPEAPLYQQITINSLSPRLLGVRRNSVVWTFNMYQWSCMGGNCQA